MTDRVHLASAGGGRVCGTLLGLAGVNCVECLREALAQNLERLRRYGVRLDALRATRSGAVAEPPPPEPSALMAAESMRRAARGTLDLWRQWYKGAEDRDGTFLLGKSLEVLDQAVLAFEASTGPDDPGGSLLWEDLARARARALGAQGARESMGARACSAEPPPPGPQDPERENSVARSVESFLPPDAVAAFKKGVRLAEEEKARTDLHTESGVRVQYGPITLNIPPGYTATVMTEPLVIRSPDGNSTWELVHWKGGQAIGAVLSFSTGSPPPPASTPEFSPSTPTKPLDPRSPFNESFKVRKLSDT